MPPVIKDAILSSSLAAVTAWMQLEWGVETMPTHRTFSSSSAPHEIVSRLVCVSGLDVLVGTVNSDVTALFGQLAVS